MPMGAVEAIAERSQPPTSLEIGVVWPTNFAIDRSSRTSSLPGMRGTAIWILIVTILAGLLLSREIRQGALRSIDETFLDWLAGSAGEKPALAPVTFVEIDDTALKTGEPWPWKPLEYALFARAIQQGKPGVTVIDPVLQWAGTEADLQGVLLENLLELPKVVVSADLGTMSRHSSGAALVEMPVIADVVGQVSRIPEFTAVTEAPSRDFQLAFDLGFQPGAQPYAAPIQKRMPLLYRVRGEIVPSVSLQALINALRVTAGEVYCELGSHIQLGSRYRVPIDETGALLLDWRLLEAFDRLPFDELIELAQEAPTDPEARARLDALRGDVVLLGRSDLEAPRWRLADRESGTLAEVKCAVIAAVLNEHFIRLAPPLLDYILVLAVALMGAGLAFVRRGAAVVVLLVAIPFYALACLSVFEQDRIWPPFALPVILLTTAVLVRLFWPGRLTTANDSSNKTKRVVTDSPANKSRKSAATKKRK